MRVNNFMKKDSMKKTVLCMKWGDLYSADYVNVLYNAVKKNITGDYRFVCLTDKNDGINPNIEIYPIPDIGLEQEHWNHGAWPKISVFLEKLYNLSGHLLFIDLDTFIMGSIDDFFNFAPNSISVIDVGDNWGKATTVHERLVGTGIFCFEIGKYSHFVSNLQNNLQTLINQYELEQVYVQSICKNIEFWPKSWVISYKRSLRQPVGKDLIFSPHKPGTQTKVIAFHGKPRPIDLINKGFYNRDRFPHFLLRSVGWARDYWMRNGGDL